MDRVVTTTCRACGATRSVPYLRRGTYRYVRCAECGFAPLDAIPDTDELDRVFGPGYFRDDPAGGYLDYDADERLHRRNATRRLALLERAGARPPGLIVDVGCAAGYFLDEARRAGWEVVGVERSEWARTQAAERFGLQVHRRLEEVLDTRGAVATVVGFFQVLEHMRAPDEAVAMAHRCLAPGGHVIIETWNADSWVARALGSHWQQVSPPSVLYLTNRRGLQAMLQRAGFEGIEFRRTAKQVSVAAVLGLLRSRYRWLRRLVDPIIASRLGAIALPYRFGDLITVTARRA